MKKKSLEGRKNNISLSVYMGIVSFLLAGFTVSCSDLAKNDNLKWTLTELLKVFGVSLAAGLITFFLVWFLTAKVFSEVKVRVPGEPDTEKKRKKRALIGWVVIFVSWIPGFLAYYPGIAAYDVEGYYYQFFYGPYNNQHPLIYTLLLKVLYNFGMWICGSNTLGTALLSILQMIILSGAFAITVYTVCRLTGKKAIGNIMIAVFALYPFNVYMALSLTKDTIFATALLVLVDALTLICINKKAGVSLYILSGIGVLGVVLFRSNGKFCIPALLITLIVFIIANKTKRKEFLILFFVCLVGFGMGIAGLSALDRGTNAQQVDKREMLSVPAQQLARVAKYHKDELPEETITEMETLIWPQSLYSYKTSLSDPVKANFISYELLHYPKKYAKLYLTLLGRYPGDYVNAFLGLYAGFLSPLDTTHAYVNAVDGEIPYGLHYVQTIYNIERYDIHQMPISKALFNAYEAFANSDAYLKIPGLSLLFVPGIYIWILLYLAGVFAYRKRTQMYIPLFTVLILFLTFFLGPTVQLRYVYPIMVAIPVLLVAATDSLSIYEE